MKSPSRYRRSSPSPLVYQIHNNNNDDDNDNYGNFHLKSSKINLFPWTQSQLYLLLLQQLLYSSRMDTYTAVTRSTTTTGSTKQIRNSITTNRSIYLTNYINRRTSRNFVIDGGGGGGGGCSSIHQDMSQIFIRTVRILFVFVVLQLPNTPTSTAFSFQTSLPKSFLVQRTYNNMAVAMTVSNNNNNNNNNNKEIPPSAPPPPSFPNEASIHTVPTEEDRFVPYLRDIERVLNNHALIRQNSLQLNAITNSNHHHVNNNNNNHNNGAAVATILFHEQQQLHQQQQQQQQQQSFESNNPYTGPSQQHHQTNNGLTFYTWCNEQRRNKPSLLLYDMDGAEKCIQMIRHLQQQQQTSALSSKSDNSYRMHIPEYAYIKIMKVILQRGRLRWKRNTFFTSSDMSNNNNNNNNVSVIMCAADQLEELLYEYESQHPQSQQEPLSHSNTTPTSIEMYNLVLEAYAICATPRGDRQYAQRAQSLLQRMEEQQRQRYVEASHDQNYNSENDHTPPQYLLPVESYLHVLHAFAWQQGNLQSPVNGADEAYKLLQVVQQLTDDISIIMQATIWVLEAYSKSMNGAIQCNMLLQQVKDYNTTLTLQNLSDGDDVVASSSNIGRQLFDAEVYSNAILAWSKAAAAGTTTVHSESLTLTGAASKDAALSEADDDDVIIGIDTSLPLTNTAIPADDFIEQAAKNAHNLLLELVDHYLKGSFMYGSEPPLIAFNGVISAYSRLGHIDLAEDVLWLMEREVRPKCTHLIPNAISYNSILHGIYRQSQQQPQNSRNNNINNNKYIALQKALSILTYMEENSNEQPAIQPNAFSYQTIMKCWLQCSNGNDNGLINYSKEHITEQAELLLYKVEQLWGQGDTSFEYTNRIYNMLLNAYAKTYNGKRFLSNKAMNLLSRMKQSTHNVCQPDIISYTSTLECIAQSSDPAASELADELLQEVKMRYATTNDVQLRPNLRTYTMTIQTLARNNGNIIRARELLTELVHQYELSGYDPQLKPNTFPYNYVLNCAANTMDPDQRLQAFQIATQTYQEMRQSKTLKPDSFSYAFWFKCCNNLLDPGPLRTKGMMYAFEECKRDGLVSSEVLTRLLQGCPKDVVTKLLELPPSPSPPSTDSDATIATTPIETTAVAPTSQQYATNIDGQNFFQQRRNNVKSQTSNDNRTVSSFPTSTSSFRPRDDFMKKPNDNNSVRQNNLTVRDLPPSWSRNTMRTKKG